ncbi:MAG: DUF4325 domain-containing protein [Chlorobi bacterium]|nr:DUF4325 domain-containing protein [Chlorobiota bacterium]NOG67792.1 STAS-like domain-containing protein [Chlorobiota bacterium]
MSESMIRVRDWTIHPGPRYKSLGSYSAELYLEEVLDNAIKEAEEHGTRFTVDLDGVLGYGPSFIDGSFGEIARRKGRKFFEQHFKVTTTMFAYALDELETSLDRLS